MSLMRRWLSVYEAAAIAQREVVACYDTLPAKDEALMESSLVPADQLRGAVEALREFQDAYVREFGMGRGSDFVVRHVETIVAKLSRGTE